MGPGDYKVGLLIRSAPVDGPFSRQQLDIALSAASLGYELELFFVGSGAMQIAGAASSHDEPGGHKGWKALPGLSRVSAWMSETSLEKLKKAGLEPMLDVKVAEPAQMAERLSRCRQAMVV